VWEPSRLSSTSFAELINMQVNLAAIELNDAPILHLLREPFQSSAAGVDLVWGLEAVE
jgi:hypothetical protein